MIHVKFPMSDVPIFRWKNFDVRYRYRLLVWILVVFLYSACVYFVLFLIDVTAIKYLCLVCRTFDHRSNNYITFSHWRPAAYQGLTAMHYWCGQWDSPMFSLAPILPMFDVRCVNRPNSICHIQLSLALIVATHSAVWTPVVMGKC